MTTTTRRDFAARVDAARQAQGISVRRIGRIAGVPAATAHGWLTGRHFPVAALRFNYLRLVEELGLLAEIPPDLWHQPRLRG